MNVIPERLLCEQRYHVPMLWARRITRSSQTIDTFSLDARTALELGDDNVGVFVGGCNPPAVIEQIKRLRSPDSAVGWVVVTSTKEMALALNHKILDVPTRKNAAPPRKPVSADNITVATPETLRSLSKPTDRPVAAILVHDMHCRIHLLRGDSPWQRDRGGNDRPQAIAEYRYRLAEGNWMPPLFLLTEKPLISVETEPARRAYSLDTWWFLAGHSLICGVGSHQPAVAEPPPSHTPSNDASHSG